MSTILLVDNSELITEIIGYSAQLNPPTHAQIN